MRHRRAFRFPPAGRALGASELATLRNARDAPERLRVALRAQLDVSDVALFASGREALRIAFAAAAKRTGRREAILPAYTCFSVAAAAVAAGLRVRLVDVQTNGALDVAALSKLPLERAAAVVVCNLFGFAEPVSAFAATLRETGVSLVDDAAQALGARAIDGAAGSRGDVGVLSFGRGKPLSALGGGALVFRESPGIAVHPAPVRGKPLRSLLRGLAYDLALSPRVFGWLASVPALGIGETPFEPAFPHGGIPEDAAALALAVTATLERDRLGRERTALAISARLRSDTRLVPLAPAVGATGAWPRLACLAPDARTRDCAVAALAEMGAGVSTQYPTPLGQIAGLAPHLVGETELPGARALAARLLTLPTHGRLRGAHLDVACRSLRAAGCT